MSHHPLNHVVIDSKDKKNAWSLPSNKSFLNKALISTQYVYFVGRDDWSVSPRHPTAYTN